uniref:Uncharacterized protein n=1 Tax=Oryza barthii TaxID=65489 RepID=A0A0D3EQX1_9ORYZ
MATPDWTRPILHGTPKILSIGGYTGRTDRHVIVHVTLIPAHPANPSPAKNLPKWPPDKPLHVLIRQVFVAMTQHAHTPQQQQQQLNLKQQAK